MAPIAFFLLETEPRVDPSMRQRFRQLVFPVRAWLRHSYKLGRLTIGTHPDLQVAPGLNSRHSDETPLQALVV